MNSKIIKLLTIISISLGLCACNGAGGKLGGHKKDAHLSFQEQKSLSATNKSQTKPNSKEYNIPYAAKTGQNISLEKLETPPNL